MNTHSPVAAFASGAIRDLTARRARPPAAVARPLPDVADPPRATVADTICNDIFAMLAPAGNSDALAMLAPDELAAAVIDAIRLHMAETDYHLTREDFETVQARLTARVKGNLAVAFAPLAEDVERHPRADFDAMPVIRQIGSKSGRADRVHVEAAKTKIQQLVVERMDVAAAAELPREEFERQLAQLVMNIVTEAKLQLNSSEQHELVALLVADMLGLGPLEPLLGDESITDIMVNGPYSVFVERGGKLVKSGVTFRDNAHVMAIATRMVTRVGRRVDETTPLCDARLDDGSRINVVIPPLAIDGPSISIRKFSKRMITLDSMVETGNISRAMSVVLKIAARCRLNILISGGTGSGKTTMLNALSRMIDPEERTVTIEDAAELQLQQPHVVRLETRPPNLEGNGGIGMRELLKNALRMRPDRIILGEIRGAEVLDVLQAMNTGHDGSMSTLHANTPREALTRIENMVSLAGVSIPPRGLRSQIVGAVHMIIQISRMRDGVRRVTHITEVVGMEGDVVTTQDLFTYEYEGEDSRGRLRGNFQSAHVAPHFLPRAAYYGLERALREAM
jgi:pilus assembly protein CpaF